MIKINKYELKGDEAFSIAHFSDIHYSYKFNEKKLQEIIDNVKKMNPSYICITGDLVDSVKIVDDKKLMTDLTNFIKTLASITKVIIGIGNHDNRPYNEFNNIDWFLKLKRIYNVFVLDNECYVDHNILFYGFTPSQDYYHDEFHKEDMLLKEMENININKKTYNILLCHTPFHLDSPKFHSKLANFNLVLAGHTHNGLMPHFIKGNFAFITPNKKLFAANARNSFKNKEITIIISGGITKLSYGTGLLHFFDNFYKSDINYIVIKN